MGICTTYIRVRLQYFVTGNEYYAGWNDFELKSILKRGTKSFYSLIESLANTHK